MSTGDPGDRAEGSALASTRGAGAAHVPPAQLLAHRAQLQRAQQLTQLTLAQLWLRFFALGGDVGLVELEAYMAELMVLPARQRDLLAQAANECLDELLASARVSYSQPPAPPLPPPQGAALLDLLADAHLASPDQLPALAEAAFGSLGLQVTLYLVDHGQRYLVPATDPATGSRGTVGAPHREPLSIDGTLAGRAFRDVQVLASDVPDQSRLWLPLLDGSERLGVLDVRVPRPGDLVDPVVREQCNALATLVGQLVTSVGARGDALDSIRRLRPRTPSAELVWQLLPPATAACGSFTLSGRLEPADAIAGDTFDYSLSDTAVSLAVFDAMGHGMPAGLMAAAAVSAYRSARRNGEDLRAQARAVDASIAALGQDGSFVTGFLGELDLTTGRLCYLSAGHPNPLLLRAGRMVRTLTGGRRVPFGLDLLGAGGAVGAAQSELGREDLEPGDWLVVHTDGVTEARDEAGEFFGEDRLVDFLSRAVAAGQPPPETARRLTQAVLAHQRGRLQDDATVVLSCWQPRRTAPRSLRAD